MPRSVSGMTAPRPAPVRYEARFAAGPRDVRAAQRLRHRCFLEVRGRARPDGLDQDEHDALCDHVLVEDGTGRLVACYRLRVFSGDLSESYAAQSYDLSRLERRKVRMIEVGRFCIAPEVMDPDALRTAWGTLTKVVDAERVRLLFGCASLPGAEPARHRDALAFLAASVGPDEWIPGRRAEEVVALPPPATERSGLRGLPPLLRTYLAMGGWVSDHAVVDRDLDTLHVFTAVETARVPAARARALRGMASALDGPAD
jgi:L-ornithine Nalpha-acyltransferase